MAARSAGLVNMQYKHVVVGCGYVGQKLLSRLAGNVSALGVSRTRPEAYDQWLCVDLDCDDLHGLVKALQGAVLYYFVAPSTISEQDDRSRRLLAVLAQSHSKPSAVVLISTTGVYGDCGGQWVDETCELQPVAARSIRRVDAEGAWSDYAKQSNIPLAILRVAGIYGPGKLPHARLTKKQPLLCEGESPCSNRVHVDDLVDTALAAADSTSVINVADGAPSTMTTYFHALADALGVQRLPEADRETLSAEWSVGLRSYMSESRKIDNTRMRELLGGSLRHPDLIVGLAASVAVEQNG